MQSCMTCQREEPLLRIKMDNHRFCSAACVVKYAGTNKDVPWLKSETYQMYYEMDFDERIKGTLSEQDASNRPEDTGHQAIPSSVHGVVETTLQSGSRPFETVVAERTMVSGSKGSEGPMREEVCLCRSGVLTKLQSRAAKVPMDSSKKSGQNCSNKVCACFPVLPGKTADKGS